MAKKLKEVLNKLDSEPVTPGRFVRSVRKNFGITLKELEDLTGIKETNLSALENEHMEMSRYYAEILGAALGVHPSTILFPEGYESPESDRLKEIRKRGAKLLALKRA